VDVDRGERSRAEEARREDARVALQHDEVGVAARGGLRGDRLGEGAALLDRDERAVGVAARERERVPPVAGPDLELEARRGRAEPRRPVRREVERDGGVVLAREDHQRACVAW
jgi:hypothetical protein